MKSLSRRDFLQTTTWATAGTCWATILLPRKSAGIEPTDGWVSLFDGKTLNGWHKNPQPIGHGTGGIWQVEDGVLTGQQDKPGSGNGGVLLTDQTFGDFELSIDLKPDWGVCSGLFVRGNDRGQCFQMMVDYHDSGNVGQIYGEGTGGFGARTFDINGIYDDQRKLVGLSTANHKSADEVGLVSACQPEDWLRVWKIDQWNTARVRVAGGNYPRITTWINDLNVCEFDAATSQCPRYDKESVFKLLGSAGSVAVQVHGGKGWPKGAKCRWKDIKIRTPT